MMVLPLAIVLAYCSGPNNTQTTTDTDIDATSTSASTTTTTDVATTSTDVSDETTTASSITGTTIITDNTSTQGTISSTETATITMDPNDPMYQHWQRTNGQHWTYDLNYPGYDRPAAGTYNSAINGSWQLVMTPELVTAWRQDNSRSLWMNQSNTYLSASESFNTQTGVNASAGVNGTTSVNGSANGISPVYNDAAMPGNATSSTTGTTNTQGSVQVNGSTNAATLSSGTNAGTHGLNNSASGNATVVNQMNGGTANSSANTTVSANANTTLSTTGVTSSTNGTLGTTETTGVDAGVNGSVNTTTSVNSTTSVMDINSINYNAANGNMYQLPKFNLFLDNGSFTGYTGCNGISGRVEVTGTGLRFLNTNTSTAIDCMGGFDEAPLLDMLKRVDSYAYVGDELHLMQGSQVLLKFKKGDSDTSLR